jgi:hypothetical protein
LPAGSRGGTLRSSRAPFSLALLVISRRLAGLRARTTRPFRSSRSINRAAVFWSTRRNAATSLVADGRSCNR